MEKKQRLTKLIIATIFCMVLCISMICISVNAATFKSESVQNSVMISSSLQTRTDATVSYAMGPKDGKLFDNSSNQLSSLGFTTAVKKAYDINSKDGVGPNIVFSYENQISYVAYKLDFENKTIGKNSNITIDIKTIDNIPLNYQFNDQIDVYFGKSNDLMKIDYVNGYNLNGTVDIGQEETYYIVIAVNKELSELNAAPLENFNISVIIN